MKRIELMTIITLIAFFPLACFGQVLASGDTGNRLMLGYTLASAEPVATETDIFEAPDQIGTDAIPSGAEFAAMTTEEFGQYCRAVADNQNRGAIMPSAGKDWTPWALLGAGIIVAGVIVYALSQQDSSDTTTYNVTGDRNHFTTTGDNGYDASADNSGDER